jgi:uncharacterized protein (DUF1800 family)
LDERCIPRRVAICDAAQGWGDKIERSMSVHSVRASWFRPMRIVAAFTVVFLLTPLLSMSAALGAGASAGRAPVDQRIVHVLDRLAFGPNLEDFRHVEKIGVERYIAEQLDPAAIPEPFELRWRLARLATLNLDAVQLRLQFGPLPPVLGFKPTPEEMRTQQQRARIVADEAAAARIYRAVMSPRQLLEVMVDFWFNHFNVFVGKGLDRIWIGNYEQVIRRFALGRFRDLLLAVAKHPAMLVYLDGTRDTARGLNENFAREVMELHTLGVDGGYTQADVTTLARVFTGWSINPPNSPLYPDDAAVFAGARHDFSPKVFLGVSLADRGRAEGEEALDMLAASPATAHHIAYELAQYFVADAPPPALVDRLAARFSATDGDIREVLKTLFASPEFWASAGQKYKTPYEFVVSALRAAGLPLLNPHPALAAMRRFGMPLYGCETPDGYPNTEAAWLSPDASLQRIDFAVALARGALPVSRPDDPVLAAALPGRQQPVDAAHLEAIFGSTLSQPTRQAVATAAPALRAALILGSPDFMRR